MFESNVHSFVAKIWLEESAEEAGRAIWRGMITHVPSGRKCYLQRLGDITAFVALYLEEMGVETNLFHRCMRWLRRRKRHEQTQHRR